jgi:hypothetical protein
MAARPARALAENPVRLAEELSMIDMISKGRPHPDSDTQKAASISAKPP